MRAVIEALLAENEVLTDRNEAQAERLRRLEHLVRELQRVAEQPLGLERRRKARRRGTTLCLEPAQHGAIVVTQHDGLESLLEPPERLFRVRATIDQVPDAEEPVGTRVKPDRSQSGVERAEATVHIADDEVAAKRVDRDLRNAMRAQASGAHGVMRPAMARGRGTGPNPP